MRRLAVVAASLVALALCAAGPEAGLVDAGVLQDGGLPADAGSGCAALEARIARRKAWLAARRQEQFERGGAEDPKRGVPNMVRVWCEAHPADPDCLLGNAVLEATPDELAWSPDAGIDEYDPHVVRMKRELRRCREAEKPFWHR